MAAGRLVCEHSASASGNLTMPRKPTENLPVPIEQIDRSIHVVRGQRVMLDEELAKLYGVPTFVLNQAVKRNRNRFPDDFAFQLTQQEFTSLISQIAISKPR